MKRGVPTRRRLGTPRERATERRRQSSAQHKQRVEATASPSEQYTALLATSAAVPVARLWKLDQPTRCGVGLAYTVPVLGFDVPVLNVTYCMALSGPEFSIPTVKCYILHGVKRARIFNPAVSAQGRSSSRRRGSSITWPARARAVSARRTLTGRKLSSL